MRVPGCLLLALLAVTAAEAQEPLRFLHDPAVSPDGQRVAFVWRGDLWLAGTAGGPAQRLTETGDNSLPVFSPDGSQLAFSSSRAGNWDVYVMASSGGRPRRLTYHAADEVASDFTPDGREILFASRRYGPEPSPLRQEFVVPVAGGTPRLLQRCGGSVGRFSPDGRQLAFVRGGSDAHRRNYRGGAAEDIWLHDLTTDRYQRATADPGVDTSPLWLPDGRALVFVSDRAGVRNLYRLTIEGGLAAPLTEHHEPVGRPSLARHGSVLCYECEDRLWRLDLPDGQPRPLEITGPGDRREADELWQTLNGGAGEFAVAPSGKEVAFVVRGDIYVTRYPEGGPTRQLTDTAAEEGGLSWSVDSKTLWYSSDRDGQCDLYTVASADPDEPRLRRSARLTTTRRTKTPVNETDPQIAPDGKRVAYVRDRGDIVVADLELKQEKVVSRHWTHPMVRWSPDSRWLAYAQPDQDANWDVWLVSADGGKATNVSQHPRADYAPTWSADGSKLGFLSQRGGEKADGWFVWLQREEWEKTRQDRADAEDDAYDKPARKPAAPAKGAEGQAADAKAAPKPPVPEPPKPLVIDLEGLSQRISRLTASPTGIGELAAAPDGKSFAYTVARDGKVELGTVTFDGTGAQTMASFGSVGQLSWAPQGRTLRFLRDGGRVCTIGLPAGPVATAAFEAVVHRSVAAERAYLYDTVWRTMREEFYDPAMHGVDWAKLRDQHRPRALAAPSRADFDDVVNDLLGELNASHMGFYSPRRAPAGVPAGELGVVWDNDRTGQGLKVAAVVPHTPADRGPGKLRPGDRVVAVDGRAVDAKTNVDELLLGTVERLVTLEVVGADGKARPVALRPITAAEVSAARYEAWVLASRAEVERLSGGRAGYLHIRAMGLPSLAAFERDLYAAGAGKQALLIDVRWNPGGHTADLLLDMLMVRPHAYAVPRGGPRGYPVDRLAAPAWLAPAALLINGFSVSNAEILAHAFRTLKRGPVVGTPTNGGVISTGATTLVDGSLLRLPLRGWYRVGDGVNLEGNPAQPDVEADLRPEDEAAGRDPQLAAAVKAVLATPAP